MEWVECLLSLKVKIEVSVEDHGTKTSDPRGDLLTYQVGILFGHAYQHFRCKSHANQSTES